ncbi:MAG: hypothetical protein ACRDBO_01895 [Lachnospiraceae bacterium]
MKKYMICLILFLVVCTACLTAGYMITREGQKETAQGVPATELETETVQEDRIVSNQENIRHEAQEEEYYLVSEDGFLLVFNKDKETICLHTHIPLIDFPENEQGRLREGIWFGTMMEVYNYLESHTS